MPSRRRSIANLALLLASALVPLAACGKDDGADKPRPDAAAGEAQEESAGAPGAAGSEAAAGAGGESETAQGGGAGSQPDGSSGAGGESDEEEELPTFESYSYDVVIADYYGDQGLFRVTLSDTGASALESLFTVAPGQRALWQRAHGDAVITTVKDDTYGHLYRQPIAGGDAVRITHDLAEHELVEKWATAGDTVYYAVGTFTGNSQTHAAALWKAEPTDDGYQHTLIALPEPGDAHAIYNVWSIGDWVYLPGSLVVINGGGYVFDRITPPSDQVKPVGLLDYNFDLHYGGDILTYRGQSETGGYGVYAANLNQAKPTGQRLSPDNEPIGGNPQLHGTSKHYFFSTKPAGAGERGFFADLSAQPFNVVPLLQSEDPEAILFGSWSTRGRYFYLNEGQPGVDVATYVVDTEKATPAARLTSRPHGEGWLMSSPDDRFYSITQPDLWVKKPNDADFSLRIDQGIELSGSTVQSSTFSSDGYHIWFSLSDGRSFIDDTLVRTPPRPIEVTPSDLPDGWTARYASHVPNGSFLLAVSTDDEQAKAARQDQAVYYLRRLPSGQYAPAERIDISGTRYVMTVE